MDISKITEKPAKRKKDNYSGKPEKKINELWPFIKKQIEIDNQVLGLSFDRGIILFRLFISKKNLN